MYEWVYECEYWSNRTDLVFCTYEYIGLYWKYYELPFEHIPEYFLWKRHT